MSPAVPIADVLVESLPGCRRLKGSCTADRVGGGGIAVLVPCGEASLWLSVGRSLLERGTRTRISAAARVSGGMGSRSIVWAGYCRDVGYAHRS